MKNKIINLKKPSNLISFATKKTTNEFTNFLNTINPQYGQELTYFLSKDQLKIGTITILQSNRPLNQMISEQGISMNKLIETIESLRELSFIQITGMVKSSYGLPRIPIMDRNESFRIHQKEMLLATAVLLELTTTSLSTLLSELSFAETDNQVNKCREGILTISTFIHLFLSDLKSVFMNFNQEIDYSQNPKQKTFDTIMHKMEFKKIISDSLELLNYIKDLGTELKDEDLEKHIDLIQRFIKPESFYKYSELLNSRLLIDIGE